MGAKESNHFEFVNAGSDGRAKVLKALMSDFSYARHAHEELAVGVTMEGVQEFSSRGCQHRSCPGDIILFNPDDVHNGNPGSREPLKYTMLYLDTEDFYPLFWSATGSQNAQFPVFETHFKDHTLASLILEMSRLVSDGKGLSVEYEQYRYQIAKRLAQRVHMARDDIWMPQKDSLLRRVRDYIHDKIKDDISVDDLSLVAGVSKYHFIRMFRSQFGMTPHQYILNLKVNRAQGYLETGMLPSDVAQEFGFFDVSHLNRHFKRATGLTPKQYQLQLTSLN